MSDIQFTLTAYHFRDMPTRRAAVDALGIEDCHMRAIMQADKSLTIIATAAQFGLFIAMRCLNGCTGNTIQNLQPKLICDPRPAPACELVTKVDIRRASR